MKVTSYLFQVRGPSSRLFEAVQILDSAQMDYPWSVEQWQQLHVGDYQLFTYTLKEELMGFALYLLSPNEGLAHLLKLVLLPETRGTGHAQQFWAGQLKSLRDAGLQRIYLEVAETNLRARAFYTKMGCRKLHVVKGFYHDGASAVTMELVI